MVAEPLTEYERQRIENIRRNDEMMASLMVQQKAADLSAVAKRNSSFSSPPLKKSKYVHRVKKSEPVVLRRSLRSRGIPADSTDYSSDKCLPEPLPPSPVRACKRESITLEEAYVGDHGSNTELVDTVLRMSDDTPVSGGVIVKSDEGWDPRISLILKPENVNRFMPGRILNVNFLPFADRAVIAAGDKFGNVGFWDVDYGEEEGDGVYLYAPHSAPVSAILIKPTSLSKIFTSSYDGLIRSMDVKKDTFNMIYSCEDAIYSMSQPSNVNSLFFGEGRGQVNVWDISAGKLVNSWELHHSRINTIDFNSQNTNMMATSSTDGRCCIWDLRSIKNKNPQKLQTVQHAKAVHSAYFSPTGRFLATTSLDDYIGISHGVDFNTTSTVAHDNKTGRWISTFRAIWGWDDRSIFMGNMKRAIDIISSTTKTTASLESPLMTAIPSRLAAHPNKLGYLAGATAGGQVYMWRSD